MNTQGTEYGSYAKSKNNTYQVVVTNPLTKERNYLGYFKSENEAKNVINNWNFNFFSEHSWSLPRCISLDRRVKDFVFSLHLRGKSIRVCSSKSLDEVVKEKISFIGKMI